jgi:hypothetical protein
MLDRWHTAWFLTWGPGYDLGTAIDAERVMSDVLSDSRLLEAAEVVLSEVQRELSTRRSPVEFQVARLLMRERLHALTYLINYYGPKVRAKREHLRITGGVPLTICMGEMLAVRPERWQKKTVDVPGFGEVGFTVPGCLAVFKDATHATGPGMWPWYCKACRSDRKHPVRDARNAVLDRLSFEHLDASSRVYAGWS